MASFDLKSAAKGNPYSMELRNVTDDYKYVQKNTPVHFILLRKLLHVLFLKFLCMDTYKTIDNIPKRGLILVELTELPV